MKGNEIVLSPGINGPRGRMEECIVDGTPKPGTCMQMKAATAPINGAYEFEVYNTVGDGVSKPVIVLREDHMQGKRATVAYADGDHGFLYWPQVGDELNMLIADPNTTVAIGDKFIIDDSTGKLIAAPTPHADYTTGDLDTEAEIIAAINLERKAVVFESREAIADPGADTLLHCVCVRNC